MWRGRLKIYTDQVSITRDNVIGVLQKALESHNMNRADEKFLLDYDKGVQPLARKKTVRADIDITNIANTAHEISEWKLGYMWGKPIAIVQKSDKYPTASTKDTDNSAIAELNQMYFLAGKDSKDQELGRYVEICGVGYQMIDIDAKNPECPFKLATLNPMFTFVVYSSDVYHKPLMGVTFVEHDNLETTYTCVTDDSVYIIENSKIVNGEKTDDKWEHTGRSGERNPLGEVNIIEWERAHDRTGCFERQISEMDALNILASDLSNDVSQTTQAIWWGNDIELERDENGVVKGVQGGQWILTKTAGNGQKPSIDSITLQYDYQGVLNNIQYQHDAILKRAFVPVASEANNTTGTATSMTSGWASAEAVACKEELVLKYSFQQRNALAVKIAKRYGNKKVANLSVADIDIRFPRNKTFDLATKVNSLATMIDKMVSPRVAMALVDVFPDLAQAIEDSEPNMVKYQELLLANMENEPTTTDRTTQDSSDQAVNSPASAL